MDNVKDSIFDYLSGKISFEEWINVRENAEYVGTLLPEYRPSAQSSDAAEHEGTSVALTAERVEEEEEEDPYFTGAPWASSDASAPQSGSSEQMRRANEGSGGMLEIPQGPINCYGEWLASDNLQPPTSADPVNDGTKEILYDSRSQETGEHDKPREKEDFEQQPVLPYANYAIPKLSLSEEEESRSEEYEILYAVVEKISQLMQNMENVPARVIGMKSKRGFGSTETTTPTKKRKPYRSRARLNYVQRLQMGQANMFIANQEFEKAIPICTELIRQVPNSQSPFRALGLIYEEMGDHEKALQYSLIAAFLGTKDINEWLELANKCSQEGLKRQEIECFNQACKSSNVTLPILWTRSCLYLEGLEYKKALDGYASFVKAIPGDLNSPLAEVTGDLAKLYHKGNQSEKAFDILETVIESNPDNVDPELLNMLMELYIGQLDYRKALDVILSYGGVHVPAESERGKKKIDGDARPVNEAATEGQNLPTGLGEDDSSTSLPLSGSFMLNEPITDTNRQGSSEGNLTLEASDSASGVYIPEDLPIDLRAKLAVCCIQEEVSIDVQDLLSPLFVEDVEDFGDIYLDVAEAYGDRGEHGNAVPYLEAIAESEKFGQAGVWLKLAKSLEKVHQIEKAVDAFYKVVKMAPQQVGVSLDLFSLLKKLKRDDEAFKVLADLPDTYSKESEQEKEAEKSSDFIVIDKKEIRHWFQKCALLYRTGNSSALAKTGYILFRNYFNSTGLVKEVQKGAMFEMFRKVLSAFAELGHYKTCLQLIESAAHYRYYADAPAYRVELEYFLASVSILQKDYKSAFDYVRNIVMRDCERAFHSVAFWNLYTYIVNRVPDRRHHRYMNRQLVKYNTLLPLIIQNGHNSFVSGTYKYALGEYVRAFRLQPSEPLLSLLIAVTLLHYACQKFVKTRHTIVLQGIIFVFHYFYLRGQTQEAYYNVGRAFHQVGLVNFSVHFYNRALAFPFHGGNLQTEEEIKATDSKDLHREAAFNLSRIYASSGNRELAREILNKYCWV